MGMSASQARMLTLQARQADLEYQGQQINQERSVLSQQVTALYNSLLGMDVPTPPSTAEFTKIQYNGKDGATSFSIGNVIPTGDTYTVEMSYQKTGHYIEEKGTAAVTEVPQYISLEPINPKEKKTTTYYDKPDQKIGDTAVTNGQKVMCSVDEDDIQDNEICYELNGGKFIKLNNINDASNKNNLFVLREAVNEVKDSEGNIKTEANFKSTDYVMNGSEEQTSTGGGFKSAELSKYYIADDNKKAVKITEDMLDDTTKFEKLSDDTYIAKVSIFKNNGKTDASGYENPDYNEYTYYVGGSPCMSLSKALNEGRITQDSYDSYIEALKAANQDMSEMDASEVGDSFQVYFTEGSSGLLIPHFVKAQELRSGVKQGNDDKFITSYDYTANGTHKTAAKETDCQLTFDASGRIISISIPTSRDGDKVLTRKTIEVEAVKVTDDNAYKDAYNKYEYAQYEYDKKQKEINAKTEIIQKQDRDLELKLQRLDNERTQIKTEIDALDKVINDNIEKSYKTFSG